MGLGFRAVSLAVLAALLVGCGGGTPPPDPSVDSGKKAQDDMNKMYPNMVKPLKKTTRKR